MSKKLKMSEEEFKDELSRAGSGGYLKGYTDCLADFLKATKQLSENLASRLAEIAEEAKGATGN